MSDDFLTRLANQSIDAVESTAGSVAVRPRLATPFEPVRHTPPLDAPQERIAAVEATAGFARPPAQGESALESSGNAAASFATIRVEPPARLDPAHSSGAPSPAVDMGAALPVQTLPTAEHAAAKETRADVMRPPVLSTGPQLTTEDSVAAPSPVQPSTPSSTLLPAPAGIEAHTTPVSPYSVTPQREPARTGDAGRGQSTPAEPTIVVTIGRVEVRAVVAPAAQPAGRQGAPVMTLEEYARRRAQQGNP